MPALGLTTVRVRRVLAVLMAMLLQLNVLNRCDELVVFSLKLADVEIKVLCCFSVSKML